jgi:uncharacterized membrane protein YvbJ
MYCPQCGRQNPDSSNFCVSCGAVLSAPVTSYTTAAVAKKSNPQATTALILGILGLFFGIVSILAIIFGGIGIHQTNNDPDLGVRGAAVAGLVLGIIGTLGWVVIAFFYFIFLLSYIPYE